MPKPSVERALPFNCPKCEAAIGALCVSKRGKPMAEYVHPEREPEQVLNSKYMTMRLKKWLGRNGHILLGDE